jgi:competence protein ComEC
MGLVLPLIGLGMLWLILWQGKLRFLGVAVVAIGLFLWGQTPRPALLISQSGGLIGLMGDEGRVFNKKRGDGFSARSWLENDGDGVVKQADAFARIGLDGDKGDLRFDLAGHSFAHLTGRSAAARAKAACKLGGWVITSAEYLPDPDHSPCHVFDKLSLAQTGAVAIYASDQGLKFVTSAGVAGQRLWNESSR